MCQLSILAQTSKACYFNPISKHCSTIIHTVKPERLCQPSFRVNIAALFRLLQPNFVGSNNIYSRYGPIQLLYLLHCKIKLSIPAGRLGTNRTCSSIEKRFRFVLQKRKLLSRTILFQMLYLYLTILVLASFYHSRSLGKCA